MAKRKITLKSADGTNLLYPRTSASQVEVTANTTLDTYMKGMVESISDGTTVVVKKANEAINLTNKPSLAGTTSNQVTVTAGGKTSEPFTIPFATSSDSATKATKDGNDKVISATYAKIQDLNDGVVVPFKAGSLAYGDDNITAQGLIDAAKQEINAATKEELNALEGKVTTNTGNINTLENTVSGHTTSIQNLVTADANFNTRITELEANASKVYTPKGSVQDVTALTRLTEVKEGWVYNITDGGEWDDGTEIPAGANAVYIGTTNNMASLYENWDILGGIVDLSNYVTESVAQQTYATKTQLNNKQDKISDLETIRSGAALGATALQSYTEKYTGTYSKPSGGIPKSDLSSAVQTSLGKADTALQSHQDISGKLDVITAQDTYLSKTDAQDTYAKQTDVGNYIGAIGDDNKPMGLTYTVDGDVTY